MEQRSIETEYRIWKYKVNSERMYEWRTEDGGWSEIGKDHRISKRTEDRRWKTEVVKLS